MDSIEPIIFEQRDDRIEVDAWPKFVGFSERLLAEADPSRVHREGNLVTITVDNGRATYRLLEPLQVWDSDPLELRSVRAERVDSTD